MPTIPPPFRRGEVAWKRVDYRGSGGGGGGGRGVSGELGVRGGLVVVKARPWKEEHEKNLGSEVYPSTKILEMMYIHPRR